MLLAAILATGCASLGGVDDGTSLSRGFINDGKLVNGARLPARGEGYLIPPTWQQRGNNFGTDELVSGVVRVARRVHAEFADATLYVADLSPLRGGRTVWHKSHQTGRDVDLIFYARDADGRPARAPATMIRYGADGKALGGSGLVFDVERNWALVRALLEDPGIEVQHLFVSSPLRQMLLDHAVAVGAEGTLVERAAEVLSQPAHALAHDDHLHVRIYCPASDRGLGCRERGPLRWFKKTYKYIDAHRLWSLMPAEARDQVVVRMCRLLSPGSLELL
jgi:penicillin-insensitive murein endopeptidase